MVKFLLKGTRAPSMYRGDHFKARLKEILPDKQFGDMLVPFFCNAVRLETGGSVFWGYDRASIEIPLVDAVYSSCALPGDVRAARVGGFATTWMVASSTRVPLRFAKTLQSRA